MPPDRLASVVATLAVAQAHNPMQKKDAHPSHSTDRNMNWVRSDSWWTYLSLDAPDSAVTYDMGISPTDVIRLAPLA